MAVSGASRILANSASKTAFNFLFYNCVLAVFTKMPPHPFYRELQRIEHRCGRIRSFCNAPRTIDIDVLLSLDLTYMSPHFFVPHQAMWERNFFVIPAIEALKSAGWPVNIKFLTSGQQFGGEYLQPTMGMSTK